MSSNNKPYEACVFAVREQLDQHLAGLDELVLIMGSRPLTFNERNSAERSIQVRVEIAIGCSKRLLKKLAKPVPSEARAAIERMYELTSLTSADINEMRGAIGMRNAIIHDDLNLDWSRVERELKRNGRNSVVSYVHLITERLLG